MRATKDDNNIREAKNNKMVLPSPYIVPMIKFEKARKNQPPLVHHEIDMENIKSSFMDSYSYIVFESYENCMSLMDFLMLTIKKELHLSPSV
jgi:hypothetical protein